MRKLTFKGKLTYYERLNSSVNGNPAYYGVFENEHGEVLRGRTASDADCAYGFLNREDHQREITYHITRSGNVIFDYIKILED